MNKTHGSEYRQLTNLAYNSFTTNTKESNIRTVIATITNAAEAFQDDAFIKMLLDYCNKIKCNFSYEVDNKTKDVNFEFELKKDSKYYFEKEGE